MTSGKTETLYGIHPVGEALDAARRTFHEIVMAEGGVSERLSAIGRKAASRGIPVRRTAAAALGSLSGTEGHQGVAARVDPYPLSPMGEILRNPRLEKPFLLLLDEIQDPHNLGALIRSALCAGVQGIIIPKDRSAAPTPSVSRASAGALEHARLARVTNMARTVEELKKEGIWIVGLDAGAEGGLFSTDLTIPLAFVIGGEEKGIRPLVKKGCDLLVRIPQFGPVGALNASAAGAVAMFEACRQRSL